MFLVFTVNTWSEVFSSLYQHHVSSRLENNEHNAVGVQTGEAGQAEQTEEGLHPPPDLPGLHVHAGTLLLQSFGLVSSPGNLFLDPRYCGIHSVS